MPTAAATPIDQLSPKAALSAMLQSQIAAAKSVEAALPAIEDAAHAVAKALAAGGTLVYAAAGSSGLMALSDACELPGTFRIFPDQIRIAMAGGIPADGRMPGDTEDDTATAEAVAASMTPSDVAVVLSASGTTPYACAVARAARAKGCTVIAIANVAGAELLALADIAICAETGPEAVEGSTRLGAGTAQKITLNMISTMAGVLLGHVHDGLMVNLNPDNIKLRKRAIAIVCQIAGVTAAQAEAALQATGHEVKPAVLVASGAHADTAAALLVAHDQRLGPCLAALRTTQLT